MSPQGVRQQLVAAAQRSVELGLNRGRSGNLSARWRDVFLITPSGLPCDGLQESDLVAVAMDGTPAPGPHAPSSEWRLHRDIYLRQPHVNAVVHGHPVFATTLACLRLDLPAVHYMLAVTGSDVVRCADYATFGTAELSAAVSRALGESRACLLANHGLVATGSDVTEALEVAVEVEGVAELYWRARQAGAPAILGEAEMAAVQDQFRRHGR